jgi:DNA-binding MarR family transcriptional regulator
MIIDDFQRGSGFLLTESARLLRKLIDRRLQPLGLTRAQWSILAILSKQEGLSQSDISARLEIEKSTAGRLIDQVEKSGWIERRRVPGDRRAWGIHLTERARQLLAQVETQILRSRTEMLHGLSAEQQEQLSEILQTVKSSLAAALELDRSEPQVPDPEETIAVVPARGTGHPGSRL